MKKLIALMLLASLTGAVIAQQAPPQNDPHARNDHDKKDKKDRHHHHKHHHKDDHKDDHKK